MSQKISRRFLMTAAGGLLATAYPQIRVAQAQGAPARPKQRTTGMLRLIANENPYGPSPSARAAAELAHCERLEICNTRNRRIKKNRSLYTKACQPAM